MSNSLSSSGSSSGRTNGNRYANIITTISLAAFLLLWGLIWNRLDKLDNRMRSIELDVRAINTVLDIEGGKAGFKRPLSQRPGRLFGPG